MKKKTTITTRRKEVWVIRQMPNPARRGQDDGQIVENKRTNSDKRTDGKTEDKKE